MKFCQPHWDELRKAIDDRGLSHLVARGGEAAIERLKQEVEGTATNETYDPLMNAHWMITGRALEMGGLYLMGSKEDGSQYCPLCEVDVNIPAPDALSQPQSKIWIKGCCDSVLQHCRDNKLVPVAQ